MGRPDLPVETQRRFWQLIRAGFVVGDAAASSGVSPTTAARWVRRSGGVIPSIVKEPTGLRLSFADREEIASLIHEGMSMRGVAQELGRAPSTISRELRRFPAPPCGRRKAYRASTAQSRADKRARRPKPAKLATNLRLRKVVEVGLDNNHSPEQIRNRLRVDFPDDEEMRVSHETIYQSIYVQGRGALKRELATHLRTGRKVRKPRRKGAERRARIPNQVNISQRPLSVQDRTVAGDWEGDLITGAQNKSAIGTLVERVSGFTMLLHLPERHGADEVQQAMIAAMSLLPQFLRTSVTWDQGSEMTNHAAITEATGVQIYFCDPHSPWQRGSNENGNGLLRQYFPKGTDLSGYHADYLGYVANQLNNRPRKRLDWRTPKEKLRQLLSNPTDPLAVALTA